MLEYWNLDQLIIPLFQHSISPVLSTRNQKPALSGSNDWKTSCPYPSTLLHPSSLDPRQSSLYLLNGRIGFERCIETELGEPSLARNGGNPVLLETLLHQRHALREVILDDGADLVFDLQVARNFFHRQHLA